MAFRAKSSRGLTRVLVVGADGIGNVINLIPLIKQCIRRDWRVDVLLWGGSARFGHVFAEWEDVNLVPFLGHIAFDRRRYSGKRFGRLWSKLCEVLLSSDVSLFRRVIASCYDYVFWGVNTGKGVDMEGISLSFKDSLSVGEVRQNCLAMKVDEGDDSVARLFSAKNYEEFADHIVVWPGSNRHWLAKRWPYYSQLLEKLGKCVVVGESDQVSVGEIPDRCVNMLNRFPYLPDLAALIRAAKGFIGNDGGVSHLAATTGTRTYILFGPTSITKNRPRGDHVHIIKGDLPCMPCQTGVKGEGAECLEYERPECMYDLTLEKVLRVLPETWCD